MSLKLCMGEEGGWLFWVLNVKSLFQKKSLAKARFLNFDEYVYIMVQLAWTFLSKNLSFYY